MGLTNAQYNAIMRDYQRQQAENYQQLAGHTEEIYSRFPEFSEIDREIASASTACARRLLLDEPASTDTRCRQASDTAYADARSPQSSEAASADTRSPQASDAASVDALRRHIAELSAKKSAILRKHGYPADYLEPHYRCPDCQDTGYTGRQKCHCFQQAAIDLLYTQSNLKEILLSENFSTFSLDYYSDQITDPVTGQTAAQTARRTLDACRRFVETFDQSFENLFLYGDTGLGKTFLSHCIARELLESAHSVIYFSSFRLFELFASYTFGRSRSDDQTDLEQHIFDCDLLIIDDLGTELVNSFVSSQLFHILNERILRSKSTLISTNLTLSTFADTYSERVFSRISSNYTMLKLIGDDIRIQKKISSGRA
jgi:DNA replication protein DnaC